MSPGTLVEYTWNGTQPFWASLAMVNGTLSMRGAIEVPEGVGVFMTVSLIMNVEARAPAALILTPDKIGWMFVWDDAREHRSRVISKMECQT